MASRADDFNAAIAAELRAARGAARMTFDQLAIRSGVKRPTLMRYLNAQRDIPVGPAYDIAIALDVELHRLVERAEERIGARAAEVLDLRRAVVGVEQYGDLDEEDYAADTGDQAPDEELRQP